ncbi:hypothetical protein [Ideonella margarita]|uniref:4-amino-4-deoxy-L-arabinose transferase-like glycosyltransferase n=1 Tax=Ideonella margarita TaxID=2984191 RepID=A0ABU9C588_9BURK
MNQPTPALVTQRAAGRLPRLALLLFCAAYVLPGLFGRDPWRNADLTAFATMQAIAEGRTPWLAPALGGVGVDSALLPHWLGALAIQLFGSFIDPALAARLPFGALLILTLALVWYATFHLARTEAAQPVAFAFGGEADPVDYARALADGALLATIATLGLLQLGHETTPELVQLSEVSLLMWGLAAAPHRAWAARIAMLAAIIGLAASGAPSLALALGVCAMVITARSSFAGVRQMLPWLMAATGLAALLSTLTQAWHWRVDLQAHADDVFGQLRLLLWFTWPTWPLAMWTLWRWRRHWGRRHIAVPATMAAIALLASIIMGGSDRALMLATPALAVLAAFALPTLQRSASAAVDWFSVFFFSVSSLAIWIIYASMHWQVPAKPLANIQRLAPGFQPSFSLLALILAAAATVAWMWLVRWRTSRHRHPLWKSMVLPASGVALSWLLTMTLLLPVLDYARSPRPLVAQLTRLVPAGSCVRAPGQSRPQVAALEVFGDYDVRLRADAQTKLDGCPWLLLQGKSLSPPATPEGWTLLGRLRRPTDRAETTSVYQQAL